jgi:hypothetical protein
MVFLQSFFSFIKNCMQIVAARLTRRTEREREREREHKLALRVDV